MDANRLDDCQSNLLLTLLICLQGSDSVIEGSDVSREPGGKFDLISVVFSRWLSGMSNAIKILLEAMNV